MMLSKNWTSKLTKILANKKLSTFLACSKPKVCESVKLSNRTLGVVCIGGRQMLLAWVSMMLDFAKKTFQKQLLKMFWKASIGLECK